MRILIKRPHLTEKTLQLASKGWYTFSVDPSIGKEEIRREIERLYTVKVREVKTVSMHGKIRKAGKKQRLHRVSDWKKAIVRLDKDQTIEAFEITKEKK